MELNFLLYTAIIILYIIFFIFLLFENIEGLMFILLFLLSSMSGYKLILDLYENRNILNIDFSKIFGENTSGIVSLFLNPLTLLLLIVMLFVFILMYLKSRIKINAIFLNVLLIVVYILFSMPAKVNGGGLFQLYTLYSIPIMVILLSLIMMMVTIHTLNSDSIIGKMKLSKKYRNSLHRYKQMLISVITLIIATFIMLTTVKRTKMDSTLNTYVSNNNDNFNYISAISILVTYVMSYFTFNDSYDLFKIIRYKLKTNDQYNHVTRGACTGNMEAELENELANVSQSEPQIEPTSNTSDESVVDEENYFYELNLPVFRKLID